jgi:hypothetical protein
MDVHHLRSRSSAAAKSASMKQQRSSAIQPARAKAFPDGEIVYALGRQLSWSQCRSLSYLDDPLKGDFCEKVLRLVEGSGR